MPVFSDSPTLDRAGQHFCGYQGTKESLATSSQTPKQNSCHNYQQPSYASARSLIRRTLIGPSPTNSRTAEVYGGFPWSKDCMATSNRADAVLLARMRAGHTPLLKAYTNLLDPSADPLCMARSPGLKIAWPLAAVWNSPEIVRLCKSTVSPFVKRSRRP